MPAITTVSLDVWGTLLRAPPRLLDLLAELLARFSPRRPDHLRGLIRDTGAAFDRQAIESGVDVPSRDKLQALIDRAGVTGLPVDRLRAHIRDHLDEAPPVLIEPAACRDLWRLLRGRGTRVVFASNSGFLDGQLMRAVLERLGLAEPVTATGWIFSDELRLAKPNPRFFERVAGGADPAAVLHVGDTLAADVVGALDAGMRAVWLTRDTPPGRRGDGAHVRASLADLAELIDV